MAAAPASSDVEEVPEADTPHSVEADDDESDKKFGELMSMFASSASKKKGKTAAKKTSTPQGVAQSRSKTKQVEEVGPSGLPYTPFELQVRSQL